MGQGKDRAKHDGGKDASGRMADGAKHPESPRRNYGSPTQEGVDVEQPSRIRREDEEDDES